MDSYFEDSCTGIRKGGQESTWEGQGVEESCLSINTTQLLCSLSASSNQCLFLTPSQSSLPCYFGQCLAKWPLLSNDKSFPCSQSRFPKDKIFWAQIMSSCQVISHSSPRYARLVHSAIAKLHWNLWGSHTNPGCTAIQGCVGRTTHPGRPGTFQVLKQKVSCPRALLSSGQTGTVSHSTVVGGMVLFEVLEVQLELQTSSACQW